MVRGNRGGHDLIRTYFTRSSKKNKRYLTRSSTKNKRIDDLTRSSKKNKRTNLARRSTKNKTTCNEGETTESLISDVLSKLSEEVASNLSRRVVSLALCNEHTVLFTCSGIAVQREQSVSEFLTSASLVKALNDKRKDHGNLKIEVHHEDNVFMGVLGGYSLNGDIAAVNVKDFCALHALRAVVFPLRKAFPRNSKVVALGRDISGKLIATSGILNFDSSGGLPSRMLSTCKISKVCEGGPLFDFDGNFLGMNLSSCTEGTIYLPEIRVCDQWWNCISLEKIEFRVHLDYFTFMKLRIGESSNGGMPNSHQVHRDVPSEDQFGDLESLGYPERPESMLTDGIILANNFEEPFGDILGEGVWSELSETVASNIQEKIVALASFNGEKRFFACTGCFIEWNGCTTILTSASLVRASHFKYEIVKNLRIEVLLPNKDHTDGILQHCNLHYNLALVSVNNYCPSQPAKIEHRWREDRELLAVGCIFKSGKLMASRGKVVCVVGAHDCKYLTYSSCRITKAGIGGPVLDFDGKFVGMNFYDKHGGGNPFLSWDEILHILEYFKEKRTYAEAGHDGYPYREVDWTISGDLSFRNSWPVPKPFWCTPDGLKRYVDKMEIRSWNRRFMPL